MDEIIQMCEKLIKSEEISKETPRESWNVGKNLD